MSLESAESYARLSDLLARILKNVVTNETAHLSEELSAITTTNDRFMQEVVGEAAYFLSEPDIVRENPLEQLQLAVDFRLIRHRERLTERQLLTFRKRLCRIVAKKNLYPACAGVPLGLFETRFAPSLAEYSGLDVIEELIEQWLSGKDSV